MRNNQPVTQIEHKMKPGDILVSRTDLKGRITYANKAFCEIVGYTEEELIGKPHNVVRHPDMPPAAFQDLWDTLKAEKPWTGIVKNRCKNGDYYWVVANASPEYDENGRVTGYISVRTAPTQEQINFAEQLYRDVNAGKATIPSTLKASWLQRLKLKTVMLAAAALSIITLFVLGSLAISMITHEKEDAELRVAALPIIYSVRQVLEYLPQHRGMANAYLNGSTTLAGKLANNEQKIDSLLKSLADRVEKAPFPALVTAVTSIQHQWSSVKDQWRHLPIKESFMMHTAIVDRLLELSSTTMHQSKLTTDPALDIAHLAEFISETIPSINERLGQLRGLGSGIAASGQITPGQRDRLLELYILAREECDALLNEARHVIHEYNSALEKRLTAPITELRSASNAYFELIKQDILNAKTISVDSRRYFTAGTETIAASLALYDSMETALASMLTEKAASLSQTFYLAVVLIVFGVLGSLQLSLLMMHKTFTPLREIVDGMQRIVEGNYSCMPVKHAFDELGDIADDMKTMQSILQFEFFESKAMAVAREREQQQIAVEKVRLQEEMGNAFEADVGSLVEGLATKAHQVNKGAREMGAIADLLATQSANTLQGVELGSSHVNSSAAAIEEMSETISGVSRQVSDTQKISAQAVTEAETATQMMEELTRVADEIGSIVGAISDIAEQTNLLALNASIEAARAGEVGRGFSVVAGEVKELANQTSRATGQIREQVESIQTESQQATLAINRICETIMEINTFTTTVSEAMEQQTLAGHEISRAAQQADISINDARTSVSELAESADNVDKSSDEMISLTDSMVHRTEEVRDSIRQFIVALRNTT